MTPTRLSANRKLVSLAGHVPGLRHLCMRHIGATNDPEHADAAQAPAPLGANLR